jgi:predicted glycosyltransferase
MRWPEVLVLGGESPAGRVAKGWTIAKRAESLRRFARRVRPDVALSHGSYAQVLAARVAGVPAVTMMDYEHQPANHVSFRLAQRVIVPEVFPNEALRRFGASPSKVIRYAGFKEELYLAGFEPDRSVLKELGVDPLRVLAVFRSPPDGALYHRGANARFEQLLDEARRRDDVQTVLLPRTQAQTAHALRLEGVTVPEWPVDGRSLLSFADVTIGGGGTMTRESALLGTPTYTVFGAQLGAVDAELIRGGWLHDLRDPSTRPLFEKNTSSRRPAAAARRDELLKVMRDVVAEAGG